jgi:hypothetical protein
MERAKALHIGTSPFKGNALAYDINDLGCILNSLYRIFLLERRDHNIMIVNIYIIRVKLKCIPEQAVPPCSRRVALTRPAGCHHLFTEHLRCKKILL